MPNTELSYDYKENRPSKLAFRPDRGENSVPEKGISVFLAEYLEHGPNDVIHDLPGYGVCEFTAEEFLAEVTRLRSSRDNDFDQQVVIRYDPTDTPRKGKAHCYIEPVPTIVQKALYKRVARMAPGFLPEPAVAGFRPENHG